MIPLKEKVCFAKVARKLRAKALVIYKDDEEKVEAFMYGVLACLQDVKEIPLFISEEKQKALEMHRQDAWNELPSVKKIP